ncbi:MAG: hypothetical protein SP1CHLAM54_16050 [Chlamydiia bacterium]|nr:hypothetical protein [Chlamydiia bacterium]MCH9616494.1 hypothetical protein [Chlamydiia bacterium]MCH9629520.1 hypothetical protein [Chlamydiia bacterium]
MAVTALRAPDPFFRPGVSPPCLLVGETSPTLVSELATPSTSLDKFNGYIVSLLTREMLIEDLIIDAMRYPSPLSKYERAVHLYECLTSISLTSYLEMVAPHEEEFMRDLLFGLRTGEITPHEPPYTHLRLVAQYVDPSPYLESIGKTPLQLVHALYTDYREGSYQIKQALKCHPDDRIVTLIHRIDSGHFPKQDALELIQAGMDVTTLLETLDVHFQKTLVACAEKRDLSIEVFYDSALRFGLFGTNFGGKGLAHHILHGENNAQIGLSSLRDLTLQLKASVYTLPTANKVLSRLPYLPSLVENLAEFGSLPIFVFDQSDADLFADNHRYVESLPHPIFHYGKGETEAFAEKLGLLPLIRTTESGNWGYGGARNACYLLAPTLKLLYSQGYANPLEAPVDAALEAYRDSRNIYVGMGDDDVELPPNDVYIDLWLGFHVLQKPCERLVKPTIGRDSMHVPTRISLQWSETPMECGSCRGAYISPGSLCHPLPFAGEEGHFKGTESAYPYYQYQTHLSGPRYPSLKKITWANTQLFHQVKERALAAQLGNYLGYLSGALGIHPAHKSSLEPTIIAFWESFSIAHVSYTTREDLSSLSVKDRVVFDAFVKSVPKIINETITFKAKQLAKFRRRFTRQAKKLEIDETRTPIAYALYLFTRVLGTGEFYQYMP